jgi:MscS family membrane protein
MDVVNDSGCGFAFPSQTHYVASDTGVDAASRARAEEHVRRLRATGELKVAGFLEETDHTDNHEPPHRLHRPAA